MRNPAMFHPLFALAAWTLLVLLLIPVARVRSARRREIDADDFKFGESARVPGRVSIPNRNYMNLLELPMLFYVEDNGLGLIGGEVCGHRGDFFGRNQAAVGLSGLHLLAGVVRVFVTGGDALHPRCVDRAGGDAVDVYPLFYVVYRRRPGHR